MAWPGRFNTSFSEPVAWEVLRFSAAAGTRARSRERRTPYRAGQPILRLLQGHPDGCTACSCRGFERCMPSFLLLSLGD
jgi:hypothetical protein